MIHKNHKEIDDMSAEKKTQTRCVDKRITKFVQFYVIVSWERHFDVVREERNGF